MQAEAFLYDLYLQLGDREESPHRRVEEMARWADNSRFHAVIDGADEIVGTIRTIFGRYDELPVGKFRRTEFSHEDPVCELASLVIRPGDRSTGVIENLYRNGWLDASRSDSTSVVALIDPWLYRVFKDVYAMPFTVIGESHHYMGSDPVPVGMALDGPTYDDLARRNPEFWAWTRERSPEEIAAWGLPIVLPGTGEIDLERTTRRGHAPRRVDHASDAGRGRWVSARRPRCRRSRAVDPGGPDPLQDADHGVRAEADDQHRDRDVHRGGELAVPAGPGHPGVRGQGRDAGADPPPGRGLQVLVDHARHEPGRPDRDDGGHDVEDPGIDTVSPYSFSGSMRSRSGPSRTRRCR